MAKSTVSEQKEKITSIYSEHMLSLRDGDVKVTFDVEWISDHDVECRVLVYDTMTRTTSKMTRGIRLEVERLDESPIFTQAVDALKLLSHLDDKDRSLPIDLSSNYKVAAFARKVLKEIGAEG